MNILVSACLLGFDCKYDGTNNSSQLDQEKLLKLKKLVTLIPFCPEINGGLSTPRTPCEISGGRALDKDGNDKTEQYIKGANEALKMARMFDCKFALLKEKSPSCGSDKIYDGTFTHTERHGDGFTAELLKDNGLKVYGESKLDELIAAIKLAKSPTQLCFEF